MFGGRNRLRRGSSSLFPGRVAPGQATHKLVISIDKRNPPSAVADGEMCEQDDPCRIELRGIVRPGTRADRNGAEAGRHSGLL